MTAVSCEQVLSITRPHIRGVFLTHVLRPPCVPNVVMVCEKKMSFRIYIRAVAFRRADVMAASSGRPPVSAHCTRAARPAEIILFARIGRLKYG